MLELLPDGIQLPVLLLWIIAYLLICREIISRLTGIRLGFWNLTWYFAGLPIIIGFVLMIPGFLLLDDIDSGLARLILLVAAWITTSAVGAKMLLIEKGADSDRQRATRIVQSVSKSGHVISEEPLGENRYRYLFSDGRTEYTLKGERGEVLHREDGPALILKDGSLFYYKEGRLNGSPAVVLTDGTKISYSRGVYDEAHFPS